MHVCFVAPYAWPVLSRETMSFKLKPVNFFDRNPALDLRRAPFEAP